MMMASHKKHIVLFCGGQSSEHEVSTRSAASIYKVLSPEKYTVTIIGIDHQGRWHKLPVSALLEHQGMAGVESKSHDVSDLMLKMGDTLAPLQTLRGESTGWGRIDMAIPVLHGPNGEDGTIQGLLRLAGIPFVGSDVLGSAVCMDKDVSKRLLHEAGIPIVPFLVFRDDETVDFDAVVKKLGLPFFLKPCNLGSSVGISKVHSREEFQPALEKAFSHDRKIIIEQMVVGREIECAVLGNERPKVSVLGEIIPHHEFYSYEAKYLDDHGASLVIPADCSEDIIKRIHEIAVQTFKILECCDLARIDFFLTPEGEIYLNEVNTFPGFTSVSMYPMLWEASGVGYAELIDQLIELALERHVKNQKLKH